MQKAVKSLRAAILTHDSSYNKQSISSYDLLQFQVQYNLRKSMQQSIVSNNEKNNNDKLI